ncbi:MAG: hypothetical protein KC422_24355 [Trueperaceae bacterium]|nr:hypothetical protein [Trueperaceae bacterium]
MRWETLVSGYVLRVAVKRHRWHIHLHNLRTAEVKVFTSFAALSQYLEQSSLELGRSGR